MKTKNYVYYSPEFLLFIPIKKLTDGELDEFYEYLEVKLQNKGKLISGLDYIGLLVNKFIDTDHLKTLNKEVEAITEEDKFGVMTLLFELIVQVYPVLAFDKVSDLLNELNMLDDKPESVTFKATMSMDDFVLLEGNLKEKVIGQEEPIRVAIDSLKTICAGLETFTSMFFIGPTGVGKTELSKAIAQEFTGMNRFLKINCAEYSTKHEYSKLIGSPPGYVGHDGDGILTTKAEESSRWVILFDEIEKADDKLFDLLLSLLDEGKLTDSKGKTLDFTNSIFLFTSNIGLQDNVGKIDIGFNSQEYTYDDSKANIQEAFEHRFKPEFINRLDNVIHFNMLNRENAKLITRKKLKKLPLKITTPLVSHIVENSFSNLYGARNINRYIRNNVTSKIADCILTEKLKDVENLKLIPKIVKGEITILPAKSLSQ